MLLALRISVEPLDGVQVLLGRLWLNRWPFSSVGRSDLDCGISIGQRSSRRSRNDGSRQVLSRPIERSLHLASARGSSPLGLRITPTRCGSCSGWSSLSSVFGFLLLSLLGGQSLSPSTSDRCSLGYFEWRLKGIVSLVDWRLRWGRWVAAKAENTFKVPGSRSGRSPRS
jgi:hypothetical protein